MKHRKHYYASKKNVLTWLMVLCMVCSAVARIVLFVGLKGSDGAPEMWSQIVLPITAAALFALITVISGKEQFYKTAYPVWMICLYYCFVFARFQYGHLQTLVTGLFVVLMLFVGFMYTLVTSGKLPVSWLLLPVMIVPLGAQWYLHKEYALQIPDALLALGLLFMILGLHVHTDGLYHPTWGDRKDGRRIRTLPAMAQVSPYIMVERQDASNLFEDSIEVTHMERYIRAKRKEGLANFGIMHVMLAAYCRAIAKYPGLNRFLSGQKVYSRGNDIQFCLVIKKEMTTDSPDTAIKVHLSPYDTAEDVYNKLNAVIEKVKNAPLDSNFDNTAGILSLVPGVLLKFLVWLLKLMDYFGLLPKFLLEVSPFHGSVFFTSMGSLGIPPVYHHLYNFGNLPAFCSFGLKRKAYEMQDDGTIVMRKYVDLKAVTDERIVDGFYYATFFKYFKRVMQRPEQLDNPPEEVNSDID